MGFNTEELKKQADKLKSIRKKTGLNRKEFSNYMGIPLRSLEEWEAGRRKMPDYLLRLISYYVGINQFFEDKGIEPEDHYFDGKQ